MNRYRVLALLIAVLPLTLAVTSAADRRQHDAGAPFSLNELRPVQRGPDGPLKDALTYEPRNPFNIFINYELGMHCVGFDVSYCCIIPPYNSIQAQVVQSGMNGMKPRLLTPADGFRLRYSVLDNSYSEGNKMKYWQVLKDVDGNGSLGDPGDNVANYVWKHLFIYSDLAGTLPDRPDPSRRLHVGREIPVNVDSGPSGKSLSGGFLDYAGQKGGNIVFTDSLLPWLRNVPLTLTAGHSGTPWACL